MLQFLPSKLCILTEHGVVYYHFAHCVNASKTSDQINGWHYRIENVIKQLVHESTVRSSRYEALGKFREHYASSVFSKLPTCFTSRRTHADA